MKEFLGKGEGEVWRILLFNSRLSFQEAEAKMCRGKEERAFCIQIKQKLGTWAV
jgi:hypothetical protein